MAFNSGLDSSREVACISVAEVTFMQPNAGGTPYFRSDMGDGTGGGFSEPENWVDHVPDGRVLSEGRALVGKEARLSRPFMPRYRLMNLVLRGLCGAPESYSLIDGDEREKYVYVYSGDEAPAIETSTFYWGVPESSYRLTGGKIVSMNIDVRRNADGGQVTGTIEWHFQRVARNIPFPDQAAQNEIKSITATAADGDGVFVLPATDLGSGGTLTVVPGDTAGEVQTKIRAIAAYNDTGVTVSGSTTEIAAGTSEVQVATFTGVVPGAVYLTLGGTTVSFLAQGDAADVKAALEGHPLIGADGVVSVTGTLTAGSGGAFSGAYTITFDPSLGSLALMTTSTSGLVITQTTDGAAPTSGNGSYLVSFGGDLAQTNIPDWPAIGGNGWTSDTTQSGSDGSGLVYVDGPYLEPDTATVYIADDEADLDSIDMGSFPNEYGVGGDDHGLWTAVNSSISFSDLWKGVYSLQKKRFATQFAPGARTLAASIEIPNTMEPGSDAEFMVDTAEGCLATGFWIRRAWKCDGYELWEDMFVTRTDAPTHGSDNDVWLKGFNLGRARNPEGASYRATLILPVE